MHDLVVVVFIYFLTPFHKESLDEACQELSIRPSTTQASPWEGKGGSQISLEIRLCPQTAISGTEKRGASLQIHPKMLKEGAEGAAAPGEVGALQPAPGRAAPAIETWFGFVLLSQTDLAVSTQSPQADRAECMAIHRFKDAQEIFNLKELDWKKVQLLPSLHRLRLSRIHLFYP